MPSAPPSADLVQQQTRDWIVHAVVGLNLCPFAARPLSRDRIRIAVTAAQTPEALLTDLMAELERLATTPRDTIETTLLVHPQVLQDFLDYNDFLDVADACVAQAGLEGEIQIASFHPDYRFADTEADDIANATNRAPWPTLHLLREVSVDEALAAVPDTDAIVEANVKRLRELGPAGWERLRAQWQTDRT